MGKKTKIMFFLAVLILFSAGASLSIVNNNYAPINSNSQNFLNIETSIDNKATLNFQSQESFGEKSENALNNSRETTSSYHPYHPSLSWPQLENDYVSKGQVVTQDDLDLYVVGNGTKAIIWNYGIHGFNGGSRARQFCDLFAENGYMVILPDYFRGDSLDFRTEPQRAPEFFNKTTQWSKLKNDIEDIILPFAKNRGAETFGTLGTCWGSYPVIRMSSLPDIAAGVSIHPSHSNLAMTLGLNETEILQEIKAPQLFMPAGNDSPNVKPNGLADQILGEKLKIIEFPEMIHGWSIRGDMSDPLVARDTKLAIYEALKFFDEHL